MIDSFFSVSEIMFRIWDYPVSHIEFFGTVFGIAGVWLAAKSKVLTWPVGLINIILFFMIYYQVQLYSDMFLQIYFFGVGVYGWIFWNKEIEKKIPIHSLNTTQNIKIGVYVFILSIICGWLISNVHIWFPNIFEKEAAFPYLDTLVAIASIFANTMLARRVIQNWPIWIAVDLLCIGLYISKEIYFVAFEFFIFTILASFGWYDWNKKMKLQTSV